MTSFFDSSEFPTGGGNLAKLTAADAARLLGGTPDEIAREMSEFSVAAKILSSHHPRLIDEHPLQWVGVFRGKIAASSKNLRSLMVQLEQDQIPASKTIIRFIDTEEKTLIL